MTNERLAGLQLRRSIQRSQEVGALCFVVMAQSDGYFDDTTILENADLFATWPAETGLECPRGTIVWDAGRLYRAMHDIGAAHRTLRPSESPTMWAEIGNPADEWPEWSQWLGVGDTYQAGAQVRSVDHGNAGDTTVYKWISAVDNNVWRPGEYGWDKAGVHGQSEDDE